MDLNSKIDKIFGLYEKYGCKDYIGEPVSQIEHMSQAAMQAENDDQTDEIILAAFLHDIGHLIEFHGNKELEKMGDVGVKDHEKIGADFLRDLGIPHPIPDLVEGHVLAKKYLTYKYPDYHAKLSDGSKQSLVFQGGPMSKEEAEAFEKDDLFHLYLKMRDYDDGAKLINVELRPLRYYKIKLINLLATRSEI